MVFVIAITIINYLFFIGIIIGVGGNNSTVGAFGCLL